MARSKNIHDLNCCSIVTSYHYIMSTRQVNWQVTSWIETFIKPPKTTIYLTAQYSLFLNHCGNALYYHHHIIDYCLSFLNNLFIKVLMWERRRGRMMSYAIMMITRLLNILLARFPGKNSVSIQVQNWQLALLLYLRWWWWWWYAQLIEFYAKCNSSSYLVLDKIKRKVCTMVIGFLLYVLGRPVPY